MTTCCTSPGATSARSSAALLAVPPSSVASRLDRPPPSFPMGVRADERITVGAIMLVGSPSVKAETTTQSPFETDADTIAIGVFEDEGVAHDLPGDELMALLDSGEAQRTFKRLAVTHSQGRRIILAG